MKISTRELSGSLNELADILEAERDKLCAIGFDGDLDKIQFLNGKFNELREQAEHLYSMKMTLGEE